MESAKLRSRGFTLVASLLLMLLMSGIAIGLLMMVNTESKVGTNDLQNNLAYHSAEGAIEKMTSDLAGTFQNIQSPSAAQIAALGSNPPTNDPATTYPDYTLAASTKADGSLNSTFGQISSGPNQGLYAQIIPVTLTATAKRTLGDEVSMTRTVEVALIPVFQFGVFSDGDLGFFSSPDLDFQGRVHTNGDLYIGVANAYKIVFHDKVSAWGNVINQVFPNGMNATNSGNNDTGPVYLASASTGCDNLSRYPGTNCKQLRQSPNDSSVVGGATSAQNNSWSSVSKSTFNSWIVDGNYGQPGGTGASNLSLPFVSGTNQPFQIIRRPPTTESTTSILGSARLANQAQIRVLISDKESDLHLSDWNGDATQDVQLGGGGLGDPGTAGWAVSGVGGSMYWAWANTDNGAKNPDGSNGTYDPDFVNYLCNPTVALPVAVNCQDANRQWPLLGGWLLVEAKWSSDEQWHGITKEWLGYGFARNLSVPNAEAGITNTVNPNAILIMQVLADRDGNGSVSNGNSNGYLESSSVTGSPYNWYPVNLYDSREGENWDISGITNDTCTPNGVMNAVELDVGNLRKWLRGSGVYSAGTGSNVDYTTQNGYILYFSDRRGERTPPVSTQAGEYGFEDTINLANNGVPNNSLEPALSVPSGSGKTAYSPEDVNESGSLDTYGVVGVGDAFGSTYANDTDSSSPRNPYRHRMTCFTTGRKNRVTGTRHVLKLVDGGLVGGQSNLPTRPDNNGGGFTVGSENPVYIQGDYNTSSADPTWANPNATEPNHAAAAVIADAVTVLSNNWQDSGAPNHSPRIPGSLWAITDASDKSANTTYYRVAIAAGKVMNFNDPSGNPDGYFGTDGGLHNFLRFLEDWTNDTLNYKGSLVSLYWSTYATGTFKCCNIVYHPPTRNYVFDPLFTQPQNLPPGTPMFRDVDNLSYRQIFTARTY